MTPEEQARVKIDKQLRTAGWDIVARNEYVPGTTSAVKEGLMSSTRGKIGALIAKPAIYSVKDKFDYKTVGGALMMGFDHALVKAHGASDAQAFESAMALTYKMVENHVVDQLREGLKA